MDLWLFLKRLKKSWYNRPISIKLDFKPSELASKDKLKKQLKKVRAYYDRYFVNLNSKEDDDDIDQNPSEEQDN